VAEVGLIGFGESDLIGDDYRPEVPAYPRLGDPSFLHLGYSVGDDGEDVARGDLLEQFPYPGKEEGPLPEHRDIEGGEGSRIEFDSAVFEEIGEAGHAQMFKGDLPLLKPSPVASVDLAVAGQVFLEEGNA